LAEYLQLLSVTDLFNFFMLMSSPKFGVERPSLHKEDIDNLPFFHIENLSETQKNRMETLSKSLLEGLIQTDEINNLFFELFGLTQIDAQVVKDTLAIELPFPKNIAVANAKPEQATLDIFSKELQTIVKPFADVGSVKLSVHTQSTFVKDGWCFVRIAFEVIDEELHRNIPDEWTTQLANSLWASQIRFHSELNGKVLWIGQLAQNRYWTKTRARILAMDILQTELGKHATYESSIHATNSN
jgi:hypothetical protein